MSRVELLRFLLSLKVLRRAKLGGLRLCHGEKTKVSTIRPKDEVQPFKP